MYSNKDKYKLNSRYKVPDKKLLDSDNTDDYDTLNKGLWINVIKEKRKLNLLLTPGGKNGKKRKKTKNRKRK